MVGVAPAQSFVLGWDNATVKPTAAVFVGDVDADGHPDIAFIAMSSAAVFGATHVQSNTDSSVLFQMPNTYSVQRAGDVNADGRADLVVTQLDPVIDKSISIISKINQSKLHQFPIHNTNIYNSNTIKINNANNNKFNNVLTNTLPIFPNQTNYYDVFSNINKQLI